jgi:hypothetical protein
MGGNSSGKDAKLENFQIGAGENGLVLINLKTGRAANLRRGQRTPRLAGAFSESGVYSKTGCPLELCLLWRASDFICIVSNVLAGRLLRNLDRAGTWIFWPGLRQLLGLLALASFSYFRTASYGLRGDLPKSEVANC